MTVAVPNPNPNRSPTPNPTHSYCQTRRLLLTPTLALIPTIYLTLTRIHSEGRTTTKTPMLGYSHLAVDGNTETSFLAGSRTHTSTDFADPWWQVDLLNSLSIVAVEVWARGDIENSATVPRFSGNMLTQIEVWVSDNGDAAGKGYLHGARCGANFTVGVGERFSVLCGGAPGRFVTVVRHGISGLSLCEVRVYEANKFHSLSTFIEVPTSLDSTHETELKVCATTKQMRAYGDIPISAEFRELEDSFTVIKTPELPVGFDTSIRSISNTAPDFSVVRGRTGDYFFMSPVECDAQDENLLVPPVVSRYPPNTPASQLKYHLTSSTGLSMVSYFMKIHLPYINKLIDRSKEMGYPESRVLFICYATKVETPTPPLHAMVPATLPLPAPTIMPGLIHATNNSTWSTACSPWFTIVQPGLLPRQPHLLACKSLP